MSKKKETSENLSKEDQVARAALVLASWDDEILEPNISDKLQKMKTETLSKYESRQDSNKLVPRPNVPYHLPKPGFSIDGSILPRYPPLQALSDRIGEISPPCHKQLTASDVADNQSRLSLTNSFAKQHCLPMLNGDEDLKKGVTVTTYGPDGHEFPMNFKFWGEEKTYVLTGGWKRFFKHHELKACTYWVTIWMFCEKNSKSLCFALTWTIDPSTTKLILRKSNGPKIGK